MLADRVRGTEAMLAKTDETLEAMEEGTTMDEKDMLETFGDFAPREFADEVKQRWGDTDAYRESASRYKQMTNDNLSRVMAEGDAIDVAFVEQLDAGAKPEDPAVQELVERHRLHVETWYPCSKEMHANLGRMYVEDARFMKHYDDRHPGLARFVCDSIQVAARQD